MTQKIITIGGFMATGKSTVGPILAALLNYRFVDLDEEIERQHSRSIEDIFTRSGENVFRQIETQEVNRLMKEKQMVISLGGGTLHWNNNHQWITNRSQLFILWASWSTISTRLVHSNRPLAPMAKQLFQKRERLYKSIGNLIDVDNQTPQEICQRIYGKIPWVN